MIYLKYLASDLDPCFCKNLLHSFKKLQIDGKKTEFFLKLPEYIFGLRKMDSHCYFLCNKYVFNVWFFNNKSLFSTLSRHFVSLSSMSCIMAHSAESMRLSIFSRCEWNTSISWGVKFPPSENNLVKIHQWLIYYNLIYNFTVKHNTNTENVNDILERSHYLNVWVPKGLQSELCLLS